MPEDAKPIYRKTWSDVHLRELIRAELATPEFRELVLKIVTATIIPPVPVPSPDPPLDSLHDLQLPIPKTPEEFPRLEDVPMLMHQPDPRPWWRKLLWGK